jgi:hypothetical protein
MELDSYYDFRERLTKELVKDLCGPASPIEEIDDRPLDRYIVGILYPQTGEPIDGDKDEDQTDEDAETPADPPVAMANLRYPSSMGMTFGVDVKATKEIELAILCARYEQSESAGDATQKWRRVAISPEPVILPVNKPLQNYRTDLAPGLELFCRVRTQDKNGTTSVTAVLVNRHVVKLGELRDAHAFFQSEIRASATTHEAVFVERPKRALHGNDEDLRSYRLLYRHAVEFGTGHGCSVWWELDPSVPNRAIAIATTYAPEYELLTADSNPDIELKALRMQFLAQEPRDEIVAGLIQLSSGYASWIKARETEADGLSADLAAAASDHMESCREALGRMEKGTDLLRTDDQVWEAFKLANSAMLQQRARTVWLKTGKPGDGPSESEEHEWRPFQLAFILICLPGIAGDRTPERELADLLWFPTGGGKTEAYLGLIAFTIFLRRLRSTSDADGVTALMRYTLRLLTIQQFERASLLICCCEEIRRRHSSLGNTPISIGLWVGQDATPNTLQDARSSLDRLRQGLTIERMNPIQVRSCVWCGRILTHRNYYIAERNPRMVVTCGQPGCVFEKELPIHLVDADIYKFHPTLIIATVDKFASLPWREATASLFNSDIVGVRPPELIIQDELHLISGPLGTLTGLYETAVDYLCTENGVRPKIIASTATIRRASQQTKALFDRQFRQFPPPGLDARDAYFAVQATRESKATRRYLGLMAPGTSQSTLLIRTYAALLQRASDLPGENRTRDPYWTLVGYFNSLRVLGAARIQVQDDVTDRIDLLARQSGTSPRPIDELIELTSREPSGNIPEYLKRMTVECPDPAALAVILATNMISVGVDIDRLGLMAVMGQPQATSEYIQSTSRVGRKYPGLVVSLFNAGRSRDRSHYESFVAYHAALYRQVESTSVTPFSSRARDRGLHAVLVALARLTKREFRPNDGAHNTLHLESSLADIRETILRRVEHLDPAERSDTAAEIDQLIAKWKMLSEKNHDLVFSNFRNLESSLLVDASTDDLAAEERFRTLWSLRDVDQASKLHLVR